MAFLCERLVKLCSGISRFEDKLNNSMVINGAVGYNINPGRLELGVGYQSHKYTDFHPQWGDMSFLTVMGN